ncbi:MAG: type II CAAX endopeptidase family protein [Gemmatimonadota bacterium]|nr:type II CAAX endopeptidase family protein [Gemmatimonadota bacterium]
MASLGAFLVTAVLLGPLLGVPLAAVALFGGLAAATLFLRLAGNSWRSLGLSLPSDLESAALGVLTVTVLCFGLVYALLVPALEAAGLPPLDLSLLREAVRGNPLTYAMTMIFVVWGSAAFAEELLFRGFVLHRLETVFRGIPGELTLAVVVQGLVFGLLHAYQGPVGIIVTGLVGVVMAVAYLRFDRNLWIPVLAHGTINSIAVTGLYLGWL